jgi:hypothetical protein
MVNVQPLNAKKIRESAGLQKSGNRLVVNIRQPPRCKTLRRNLIIGHARILHPATLVRSSTTSPQRAHFTDYARLVTPVTDSL